MPWFRKNNAIDDALAAGDFQQAAGLLRGQKLNRASRRLRKQLARALIERTTLFMSRGSHADAWLVSSLAVEFADASLADQVSAQRNHLVELTIKVADASLHDHQTDLALAHVQLIREHGVRDQRADNIQAVAQQLNLATNFAAAGQFDDAINSLNQANALRPELTKLDDRIQDQRILGRELSELTDQLQSAALACRWDEVATLCGSILDIAPQHELAIGARKHAALQMKRQTSVGSRQTSVPADAYSQPSSVGSLSATTRVVEPSSKECSVSSAGNHDAAVDDSTSGNHSDDGQPAAVKVQGDSFLIWVDGVGGYLVCTNPTNFVGQAGQGLAVSIPLQADVRQRHARIETIDGQHLVQPLGPLRIDGREVPADESQILRTGQTITLAAGVQLAYSQTHPLSKSARLDFASRHRTLPWSDGVILAGRSLIIGPNPNNHIFCPRWTTDLVFFRRGDQWFARSTEAFCIDDAPRASEGPIKFCSHLVGDDFSLTLEPVD